MMELSAKIAKSFKPKYASVIPVDTRRQQRRIEVLQTLKRRRVSTGIHHSRHFITQNILNYLFPKLTLNEK